MVVVLGALRTRLRLPLLLLALEVRPGHPSAPHGEGASRCGRFRVRGALVLSPATGHARRCCSPVCAVLDPARSTQPATDLAWGWDQAALAQSLSALGLTPPVSTEWIADSGASFHTTPDAGILSFVRPPHPFLSFFHHGW